MRLSKADADKIICLVGDIDNLLFELARIESRQNGSFTLDCPNANKATRKLYKIGNIIFDAMLEQEEE